MDGMTNADVMGASEIYDHDQACEAALDADVERQAAEHDHA